MKTIPQCTNCGRPLDSGLVLEMKVSDATALKCWRCAALHWPMLKRSLLVAVVVGTIITAINQGDVLVSGQGNWALAWKIPLSYITPFLVASWGALVNAVR